MQACRVADISARTIERWRKRWNKAKRPIEAWARDFCGVRGTAAHGIPKGAAAFVWPPRTHLAFASILSSTALEKAPR
jgi:hypothetical protein